MTSDQLDVLVERVAGLLEGPWYSGLGRPPKLSLRESVALVCTYLRHNLTEALLAAIFEVDQSQVSRRITRLTPLVKAATAAEVPSAEDAAEALKGRIALVDGTLLPCWSWAGQDALWSGKHKTTGHGVLVVSDTFGRVQYVGEPFTGNRHDMGKLKESPEVERILRAAAGALGDTGFTGTDYITVPYRKPKQADLLDWQKEWNRTIAVHRAPIEHANAHLKTWKTLFTDYRRPLDTFKDTFKAAIGLYFFTTRFA